MRTGGGVQNVFCGEKTAANKPREKKLGFPVREKNFLGRKSDRLLARLSHRISTTASDPATLTRLLLPFDLDVTGHAVVRKPSKKSCHSNRLHRLVTKPDEITGLAPPGAE